MFESLFIFASLFASPVLAGMVPPPPPPPPPPSGSNSTDSPDEDFEGGFEWDVSLGPVLNSGVVLSGDNAGYAVFSAGLGGSVSAGAGLSGRGENGEGSVEVMLGATSRVETPTGLIPGEANSRTYMGHFLIGGDFDFTQALYDDGTDPDDFQIHLLVGGGSKLSYGLEGERLLDDTGAGINQTVLIFGARARLDGGYRGVHVAPNLLFVFGGPDSMELPTTAFFSLTTGITL